MFPEVVALFSLNLEAELEKALASKSASIKTQDEESVLQN